MGSAVPTRRECRESEDVPQEQIYSLSLLERVPSGWSKEFINGLLMAYIRLGLYVAARALIGRSNTVEVETWDC